jgi:hypothetical protein
MTAAYLDGWMPMRVYAGERTLMVDWCLTRSDRLTDPFFEQTVERCLRRPFNLAFRRQTTVEELEALSPPDMGPAVAGLIFHMSRCGSTLVAQMLAALDEHAVISEAGPVDGVLRAPAPSIDVCARRLRALVTAIGRSQGEHARRVFVKFDAWHARALQVVRLAFPDTPWIFLYRDPVEVLASQAREPGLQTVPGGLPAALFGIDPAEVATMAHREYGARVVAAICAAALEHRDEAAMFLNYRHLPDAIEQVAAHFGIDASDDPLAQMLRVAQQDAKTPSLPFTRRDSRATDDVRRLANDWLAGPYEALERAAHGLDPVRVGTA